MKKWSTFFLSLATFSLAAQTSVVTQHNDHARTGWYPHETQLTTRNVKPGSFGFLFSRAVDDQIYAQPLVLMNVTIPGAGKRNVVYVATVNNSLYAFDADLPQSAQPYWYVNLNPAKERAVNNRDIGTDYNDFSGKMGTVGTPVIDSTTNTLFVVSKSISLSSECHQYLHALDATTGQEKANSPKLITAQINANGSGSVGGVLSFDALKQNQRSGLLLLNGIVYITWASHGDVDPYHGWVIGYDKSTLEQNIVYNATPEGYKGGIWMSAGGIAADSLGNLYVSVGNGSVGLNGNAADVTNRSESALKLTPNGSTLTVSSFFTPKNYLELEATDLDFGVTGTLLIPRTDRVMAGAKDGSIYVMDRNNMGGYNGSSNQVIQTFNHNNVDAHNLTSLTYYGGTQKEYVYVWSDNVPLKAIPYDRASGQLDLLNIKTSPLQGPIGYNGAFLSVSSNGAVDSTAILWTSYSANGNANQSTRPGILRALSASDITTQLWNTSMAPMDDPGNYAKFNCPTIANGKVYLATFSNRLVVYGLLNGVVTGMKPEGSSRPYVYPNPGRDIIKIACDENNLVGLRIMDMVGRVWVESEALRNQAEIAVGHLQNGVYLVQFNTGQSVLTQKLIIQK